MQRGDLLIEVLGQGVYRPLDIFPRGAVNSSIWARTWLLKLALMTKLG